MEPEKSPQTAESPRFEKGCHKQQLGTGSCECTLLCRGERYQTLTEQKGKNEIKQDEVIVYISGGGLALCANAASDMPNYIYPGALFALTIVSVIYSFCECLNRIDHEMAKIHKLPPPPERWFYAWRLMEYIRNPPKHQAVPSDGNSVARFLFVLSLFGTVITAAFS
ncbi:MAG: hypothetical protein ACR2P4_09860 [Gammaproteobacteria bacterium]